jgi:hypothetical protein
MKIFASISDIREGNLLKTGNLIKGRSATAMVSEWRNVQAEN